MLPFMQVLKVYTDLSIGRLSATAQTLYFRLFLINNRTGWSDTFQATIQRLMLETGIYSRNTIDRARKELIEGGFIEYTPGKNKQASTYRLLPLSMENPPKIDSTCLKIEPKTGNESGNKTGSETGNNSSTCSKIEPQMGKETGNNTGSKTGNKNSTCSKIEPKTGNKSGKQTGNETGRIYNNTIQNNTSKKAAAAAANSGEENLTKNDGETPSQNLPMPHAQVAEVFTANIHPIQSEIEQNKLYDLTNRYGAKWVLAAIEEAALQHGRTVKYIEAILTRWDVEGFKSPRLQAPAVPQSQPTQNSQVIPLLARRMPPQQVQRKMSCIDELAAMARGEMQ